MQNQIHTGAGLLEHPAYFAVPGAHLYTVLHQVTNPVARVLLVGPFASERQFSYNPWVRWARYLAARNIEVLRYDYRGVGESTGVFDELSFDHWREDARLLLSWFESLSPSVPILIHGMEIGAILAADAFDRGIGDALLLWAPPITANHALRAILRRWAGMEQLYESPDNRKTATEFIRELEQGSPIEVHGYQWSCALWRDSFQCGLPRSISLENTSTNQSIRPVKTATFGKNADSLVMPYRRYEEGQDLSGLYASTFEWLAETFRLRVGGQNARNN